LEYVQVLSAREARDLEAEAAREEQRKKTAAALEAEQEARRLMDESKRAAEEEKEAKRVARLAEQAEATKRQLSERRARNLSERLHLETVRDAEASALHPKLTDRTQGRKEREVKLQGRGGCVGMLPVLLEIYGELDAVSEEVFTAVTTFIASKRVRHVREILKFKQVDEFLAVLPSLGNSEPTLPTVAEEVVEEVGGGAGGASASGSEHVVASRAKLVEALRKHENVVDPFEPQAKGFAEGARA